MTFTIRNIHSESACLTDGRSKSGAPGDAIPGDGDNPRETTEQLLEGLGQLADTVLRTAMRDFLEPEPTFGDDQAAATFGSTKWMKNVALRELRLYIEDLNTRFTSLNAMEHGPAHELLDAETVVAAFERFLNPIQSDEFLDLSALPVRDLWTGLGAKFSRSGFNQLADVALRVLALRATQARQERLNKHLRRIIRACGMQLADRTEFAPLIRSACADLPMDLRAALHIVAVTGNT
jgi:hypothetical protein